MRAQFRVLALSDGVTTFKGPKMTGFQTQLGPTACLEIDGILVVAASGRVGTQDRELFRMVDIEPEAMKIIVVKSSHHFRADFERLVDAPATDIVIAHAIGLFRPIRATFPGKSCRRPRGPGLDLPINHQETENDAICSIATNCRSRPGVGARKRHRSCS